MRYILLLISVVVSSPGWAFQVPNPGMTTEQTRALTAVYEMGHQAPRPESLSRSLTFEEGDDPTVVAHPVAQHEPLPAARKMAEKAEHLARKKQHAEAIEKYRAAAGLDPQYFQAWNNLALELHAAGKNEEAEQIFRRLMQSNPEHVVAFTNLVSLLTAENRYPEAEAVARQGIKDHNFSFSANFVLGTVLIDQGKWTGEAKIKLEYAKTRYALATTLLEHWPTGTSSNN